MGLGNFRPKVDRRVLDRRRMRGSCYLALPDANRLLRCKIRDLSFAGARVHMEDAANLTPKLYFLEMRDRLAFEARIVWRNPPEVGLQFIKVYRFEEVPGIALRALIRKLSS